MEGGWQELLLSSLSLETREMLTDVFLRAQIEIVMGRRVWARSGKMANGINPKINPK